MTTVQRRALGWALAAVVAAAAATFGYGVLGEGVAAFCIPEPAKEVNP